MAGKSSFPGLLVFTNVLLLIASTTLMYLGASLFAFYLLDKVDFVSSWFSYVPYSMVVLGAGNFLVALYGCGVAATQSRLQLSLYAFLMALLFVLQLGGIFGAVELRSVITNNDYAATNALPSLEKYLADSAASDRWDALQREFKCCGGVNFNDGYKIWRNADIGIETNSVPDSCCHRPSDGCGQDIFSEQEVTITRRIYTHGCLTVMQDKLLEQVVPVLLGYAAVGVVLALFQLLCVVFACSFSAQISRWNQGKDGHYGNEERSYLAQGESMSVPNTPRPGKPGSVFGRDNMNHSFNDHGSDTLESCSKYAPSNMSDMDERPV